MKNLLIIPREPGPINLNGMWSHIEWGDEDPEDPAIR
jgi:hypothetical protein